MSDNPIGRPKWWIGTLVFMGISYWFGTLLRVGEIEISHIVALFIAFFCGSLVASKGRAEP